MVRNGSPSSGIPPAAPAEPWPASPTSDPPHLAFHRLRLRNLGQLRPRPTPSSGIPPASPTEPWPASPHLAFHRLRRRNLGQLRPRPTPLIWHSTGCAG